MLEGASLIMCRYGRIWEYLRREFDVETRFETIEDKVRSDTPPCYMPPFNLAVLVVCDQQ